MPLSIKAPEFLPAAAPATRADIKREFHQIEASTAQKIINFVLNFFSATTFHFYQNHRLNEALKNGDIDKAANAIAWGASVDLEGRDIAEILERGQTDSVNFLIAQVGPDENDEKEIPSHLEGLPLSLISVRDDSQWGAEANQAMLKLIPYSAFPKTMMEQRMLPDELFGFEIPFNVRVLAPHQS